MSAAIEAGANSSALKQSGVEAVPFNIGGAIRPLESGACVQAGGGLTFTLNATVMAFRSATLTDGVPTVTKVNSPVTVVLPTGGTLGAVTTVQARIVVALMANGELAICNQSGGLQVNEENLISTTAISAAATANNVWYSTSARTNQPYRIVKIVDAVNTAGAWADPVFVQCMGGNALTAMSSLGYSDLVDFVGSRSLSTTYYNTSGKGKILITTIISPASQYHTVYVNGVVVANLVNPTLNWPSTQTVFIPAGASYQVVMTSGTINSWNETV